MKEDVYQAYKHCRSIIDRASKCCDKDHSNDELFKEFKKAIEFFDASDKGLAERYAKEKEDEQNTV